MVSGKLAEIKANQDRLLEELQGLRDEFDKPTKLPSCEEIRPNNPLDNNQKRAFAAKWEVGGNMNLVEFVQDMARQKLADIENKVAKSDDGKAAWQDICGSSTEEEVRKRDRMYLYLCSLPPKFVYGLITCTVPRMAHLDGDLAYQLNVTHHTQHVPLGIYYNTLVRVKDGRGHSFAELEKLVDKVEDYANDQLPYTDVMSIDRSWLSGDETELLEAVARGAKAVMSIMSKCSAATESEYLEKTKKRYCMNENQKKQALNWVDWQRTNILRPARFLEGTPAWNEPRDGSFCEVGWAKAIIDRSAFNISHCGTNSVWGLVTAVNKFLFDSESTRAWEIKQYPVCKVMEEADANMCEAFFSELSSSYVWLGGANPTYSGGGHKLKDFEGVLSEEWALNIRGIKQVVDQGIALDDLRVKNSLELLINAHTLGADRDALKAKIGNAMDQVRSFDVDVAEAAASLAELQKWSLDNAEPSDADEETKLAEAMATAEALGDKFDHILAPVDNGEPVDDAAVAAALAQAEAIGDKFDHILAPVVNGEPVDDAAVAAAHAQAETYGFLERDQYLYDLSAIEEEPAEEDKGDEMDWEGEQTAEAEGGEEGDEEGGEEEIEEEVLEEVEEDKEAVSAATITTPATTAQPSQVPMWMKKPFSKAKKVYGKVRSHLRR